jgi:hypothetical protein
VHAFCIFVLAASAIGEPSVRALVIVHARFTALTKDVALDLFSVVAFVAFARKAGRKSFAWVVVVTLAIGAQGFLSVIGAGVDFLARLARVVHTLVAG